MIQQESRLKVADNSGARELLCIRATARCRVAFTGELNSPVGPLALLEHAPFLRALKTDSNGAAKPPLPAGRRPLPNVGLTP